MTTRTSTKILACAILGALATLIACSSPDPESAGNPSRPQPIDLFNGENLDGWKIFSSNQLDTSMTWRVADGTIICSGEPAGYIMTEKEFQDFHLTLEWRWPAEAGNSGVLLRTIGEDKLWPDSLEAQLQHDHAGDFWKIGEIHATTNPERTNDKNARHIVNAENPLGDWNTYDIQIVGGTVTLKINAKLVNEATAVTERAGRICLQSEGAPIEFRNIKITPVQAASTDDQSPKADGGQPTAGLTSAMRYKITTSMGDIIIELDTEKAPISVENFITYARDGHYDGTVFHRVIDNFMIQGGGLDAEMNQKPTREGIKNEWKNGLSNVKYSVAMARLGNQPDSATSQFFINVGDNAFLDEPRDGAGYAVFAKVVDGLDVVEAIRNVPTGMAHGQADVPNDPITIESVTPVN